MRSIAQLRSRPFVALTFVPTFIPIFVFAHRHLTHPCAIVAGHFSPIGGYSPTHDMALILDTARFKYPPHWVPLSMLFEAMAYEDPSTGKPRGFLKVMASRTLHSVLFALGCSVEDAKWSALRRWVEEDVKGIVRGFALGSGHPPGATSASSASSAGPAGAAGAAQACPGTGMWRSIRRFIDSSARRFIDSSTRRLARSIDSIAPSTRPSGGKAQDVHDLVVRLCMSADPDVLASRTENPGCDNGTCIQSDAVDTLLSEIEMLHLFEDVRATVSAADGRVPGDDTFEVQKRLLLVLMLEDVIVETAQASGWDDECIASLKACLMNESKEQYKVVGHEVEYLKDQFLALREINV